MDQKFGGFCPYSFYRSFFDPVLFLRTFWVFIVFCLLSSSSYFLNDIIDAPLDRQHPIKKNRPIAKGDLPVSLAVAISLGLVFFGLGLASFLGFGVFAIGGIFYLLHLAYSFC